MNELKSTKSRSLALGKDKGDIKIPSASEKSAKSLGTLFISDLKDPVAHQATSDDLTSPWLSVVDKSGLPGPSKIYQHAILPCLL